MNSTHPSLSATYFFMTDVESSDRTLQPKANRTSTSASASEPRRVRWVVQPSRPQ